MADSPITPIITEITEMQSAFRQPSCNSKLPFVEYPSTGTPPVIDFNVPQTTAFTTYGHLVKYFPVEYFKQFCLSVPENNYFEIVRTMNSEQTEKLLYPNGSPISVVDGSGGVHTVYRQGGFDPSPFGRGSGPGMLPYAYRSPDANTSATSSSPTVSTPTINAALFGNMDATQPATQNFLSYSPDTTKANFAANDLRPYDIARLNGFGKITKYVSRPPQPVPRIIVIEEYTTESFLGNYGAGRVVKTFSLFPGERTTISMRTYKDMVSTRETSNNVLDSFSEASATALDTLMQQEQGDISSTSATSGGSGSSFTTSTDTRNSQKSFGISGGLNLGFLSVGGGYGRSQSEVSTTSGGMSSAYDYSNTSSRMSNMNTLSSALNKHVQESNAARQVQVNTSTSDVSRTGEETTTVREIQNVNLNNTLNMTFRQLLQQYTVITYLSNLKFAYTNGYAESYTVVDLCNLPNMLKDIISDTDPDTVNNVLCKLLQPYCAVLNYKDEIKTFVEKFSVLGVDCDLGIPGCTPPDENFFRIKSTLEDTYNDGVVDITVKGVILKVQKQTLQTSSLIVDALLGRGDALDCFNQNSQNASNIAAYANSMQSMQNLTDAIQTTANNQLFADQQLELGEKNIEMATKKIDVVDQQIDVVTGITDPLEKATHYKKVFGDCCDVPQSCCGGGCGCDCADHTEPPVEP
jgi:hypothetical protein